MFYAKHTSPPTNCYFHYVTLPIVGLVRLLKAAISYTVISPCPQLPYPYKAPEPV